MDRINDFLNKAQEDYKYKLLALEQNIERLDSQIADYNKSISDIEASIDKSYDVMSASGSANDDKRAEITALRELLKNHEIELKEQTEKKTKIEKDIVDIKELIELYEKQLKAFGAISVEDLTAKLDFIAKLIKVDTFRAIEEIELLKNILTEKK